jgi:phosphoribosylformylglycinamidine synthase
MTTRTPRALVLRNAGINCDAETVRALEGAGAAADLVHFNLLAQQPARFDDYQILVIPGGFSHGDDIAAGRIFATELLHAVSGELLAFVERGGLVLGICNGFQVLVETGLIDQSAGRRSERRIALTDNASAKFECRWVHLRSEESACEYLTAGEVWPVPVAHAEGRLCVRDEAALEALRSSGQIALRYVTADGGKAGYPECPNGAIEEIAGVCDPTGRVLGLMPHPERNLTAQNHPLWTRLGKRTRGEGALFFERLVDVAKAAPALTH